MPPLPGDPHPSRQSDFDGIGLSHSGVDDSRDPDEDDNHPFRIILQMNEFTESDKRVKDAVLYCKSQADFLKTSGVPLYVGSAAGKNIDPQVRKIALRLNQFLDKLITLASIRSDALYSKLRILLAQGEAYETFKAAMNELDVSLKCNTIWENDSVAYRCNTCALTPCMSLCASCFQAANHEGHDFTRFFSREGGACDCGNSDVIKPMGFCPRHGENAVRPPSPSPLIVSLPRHIFMKLIVCLFLEWRGFIDRYSQEQEAQGWEEPYNVSSFCGTLVSPVTLLINFLQECVDYGGPMREAMAEILMDKDLYSALTERNSDDAELAYTSDMSLDWRTRMKFHDDRMSLFSEKLKSFFPDLEPEKLLKCECLLDELLFWVIRMNFPQNLINFSLSMLSEPNYTDALSTRFFTWYPLVAHCVRELCIYQLLRDRNSDIVQTTCSRLIHISVQMLSSEALCKRLNDNCDLVNVVLNTACYLLTAKLQKTEMTLDPFFLLCTSPKQLEDNQSDWEVMFLERNATMTQHGYWFVMGDMQNLLAHSSLAINTVLHPTAFSYTYVKLLKRMQGMNVNWRIIRGEHRENDNTDLVQRSFTLEFEALALTMFNFIGAITQQQHYVAAAAFFDRILDALSAWLHAIGGWSSGEVLTCPKYCVSFHLPLHRHLSTALTHFNDMELFRKHVEDFRKDEQLLRRILLHPLKIQVARAEYYAGMWVRNGNQLRVQAIIYAQPHINTSFQTPDLDLIRYCAANVDPDWFMDALIHNFHLVDVFRFAFIHKRASSDSSMDVSEMDDSTKTAKELGNGRSTPDDVADANWEKCAEKIKVILKDLPPGKADVVMTALKQRTLKDFATTSEPSSSTQPAEEDAENLFELGYIFNEDHADVITRMEWIDPMIASALRLLSELVVLLANCGASSEAALRSEMVNALAGGPHTHSRLRSIIAEKGSRGAESVDPVFDRILNEIADFSEPVAVPGGQMRQGSYQLKTEVWLNEFCPVLCQHRALYPKSSTGVLMDVEKMEREILGTEEKIHQMWIPYQLTDFSESMRHESVREVARILLCDRFIQLCIVVLEAGITGRPEIRETTTQLVVYLLTLAYKYMFSLPQSERLAASKRFRRSYIATEGLKVVQLPLLVFVLFVIECEKRGNKPKLLKRTVAGEFDKKRIMGGAAEYLGRLVTFISKCDEGVHLSLLSALDDCEKEKETEKAEDANDQKAIQERKAAAKRRREAVFAANKKKNSEVMKRLMEKEGLTQKDIDSIDTTQHDVRLYECPICGELDTPSTLRNPLGMLVRVTNNGLCDNLVPVEEPELSLLGWDDERKGQTIVRNFIRGWKIARNELVRRTLFYSDIIGMSTSVELKTCGHTVHMKCFNAYRETLRNDQRVAESRRSIRDVSCFLCRFSVNALLPLRIDWGFETANRDTLLDNRLKAFESLKDCIINWRRIPQTSDDYRPYSEHFTEHIYDLMDTRYWNKSDDEGASIFQVQTQLVALIKATVERCILLKKINVPERRKGTRSTVTEHLIAACVCRTTRRDEEISLSAVRDLLLYKYEPNLTMQVTEEEPLTFSDDDLINVSDIRREDLIALQSTSARERSRRHSLTDKPVNSRTYYLDKPSSVPLLLFDLKSLLVRLSAFVLDNQHYSTDDKKKLCQVLARSVLSAVCVKTILRLLTRSSQSTLDDIASGKNSQKYLTGPFAHVPRLVWNRLSSNAAYLSSLLEVIHHDSWQEEKSFGKAFEWTMVDFTLFVIEFWQHVGLLKTNPVCDYNGTKLDEALKNLGLDQSSIVPEQEHVEAWIRLFSPFLIWNYDTSRKAFSMEPLMWRPFLLLELPYEYDVLFARYFQRVCINCNKAPLFPFVCLLCSTLVCLDACCFITDVAGHERSMPSNEVERHALDCGRDACCFLALNSSLIVIVREGLAAIWGSVYLDAHGEEDRNLRRGKPLFLSTERVQCLRSDWAEQEWERTGAAWSTMAGLHQLLKDAHLYR
ncbi:hypothetical protein V3C99_011646 [Haemonchus contortus]